MKSLILNFIFTHNIISYEYKIEEYYTLVLVKEYLNPKKKYFDNEYVLTHGIGSTTILLDNNNYIIEIRSDKIDDVLS